MPPVVIAAGIGAAAGIGGGILSSNSTKKAANKAADTSLQVANQNNALAREIYDTNRVIMSPFVNNGVAASNQLNAMLGLGGGLSNGAATAQIAPANDYQPPNPNGYPTQPPANWQPSYPGEMHFTQEPQYRASLMNGGYIGGDEMVGPGVAGGYGMQPVETPQNGMTATVGAPQANAADPFRQYIANSDYGFQFGEGSNALNHGLAGSGSINSGAAMKAMEKYRQNLQAGYRGEYMDRLTGQAGMGMSAGSALAGVGQNFVGQTSANNNSAGTAAANAALMRGSADANMWSGIGSSFGNLAGAAFPYLGGRR